jgi:CRISPR/Cas system endoribonuclease Cas6 (RAMP superfamily)
MIKLILELYPEDGRIKPYEQPYGYIFRGIIMKWLNDNKPQLVHKLHKNEEIRPYSISCIINKKIPKIDFIIVSYDDEMEDALLQDLLTSEKIKIYIGQKDYYISQIRFERINIRDLRDQSKPVKAFNINFLHPISFNTSMGDYQVRFPIPVLLFGNLAKLSNIPYACQTLQNV